MKIIVAPSGTLDIVSNIVSLRRMQPVLNGIRLEGWQAEVESRSDDDGRIRMRYVAPGAERGVFGIEFSRDDKGRDGLRYWIEDLPENIPLDSFGLRFEAVENLRAFYRNGYHSWDGSFYVEPEELADFQSDEPRPEIGYAMTQLLPRSECDTGSIVMGFDRHDRFQHTFTFDTQRYPPTLTVLTLWDRKDRCGLARCESERLVIFEHPQVEEGLREWARIVVQASPLPPRVSGEPITGWCSWYNLYSYLNEAVLLDHLHSIAEVVRRENLPMRVFQIDAGFSAQTGDWLEVKPQFPRGMKSILDEIRTEGFVPGLWIAPFMVGNRSRLYAQHPDWVLRDRQTGNPLLRWNFYGEFRWHERSEEYFILDATHPDAFDYLQRVFRAWRRDWGCEYFKIDFLHYGSEYGPDRAIYHTPGMTRIEIWRRVAEMIRAEIGDATWLACGCPLWASVGLVEGMRIGDDVGVKWEGDHLSAQSLLRDQSARNFANHILWQIDPDCVLLRDSYHYLTEAEVRALAIYAGMSGGVMMTSDPLSEVSPDRLRLWRLLLNPARRGCRFPFLGRGAIIYERLSTDHSSQCASHKPRAVDPVIVQVRASSSPGEMSAVFIFNVGEHPVERTYPLTVLGLTDRQYVFDWIADYGGHAQVDRISVTVPPHDGVLLFVSPTPITEKPLTLP